MTKEEKEKVTKMFQILFDTFQKDIEERKLNSRIYQDFLNHKKEEYLKNTSKNRQVIDFIAGMTDEYFIKCYKECKTKVFEYNKKGGQ